MLRLYGNTVELIRYKVTYNEQIGEQGYQRQENYISEGHKQEMEAILTERNIPFTTEAVMQPENEWLNGMVFESYDKALEVMQMGQVEWKKYNFENSPELYNSAMMLDLDYRVGLIEMGVK